MISDPDPIADLSKLFPPAPKEEPEMPGWYRAPKGRTRVQTSVLLIEVGISGAGDGARLADPVRVAGFERVHVRADFGRLGPAEMLEEIARLAAEGITTSAVSVGVNSLARNAPAEGDPSGEQLENLLAMVGGLDEAKRPMLVIPSGWRPPAGIEGEDYDPHERGESQRVLAAWIRKATRSSIELAVEPDRRHALQSPLAAERFIEAHGGRMAGLALAPSKLLDPSEELAPALLALLLRLAPISRLLYIESGRSWPDDEGTTAAIDAPLLARGLRVPGVPRRITLRGAPPGEWGRAREEVLEGFEALGLPLVGGG